MCLVLWWRLGASVFHLVVHLNCKFCRQESRPFINEASLTSSKFAEIVEDVVDKEECTCSICYKICWDKIARIRHERRSHGSHACKTCDENFTSLMKLKYHCNISHAPIENSVAKVPEQKKKAKTSETLTCDACGLTFKHNSHLLRHRREVHRITVYNLDYKIRSSFLFKCYFCESSFTRQSDFKRHE